MSYHNAVAQRRLSSKFMIFLIILYSCAVLPALAVAWWYWSLYPTLLYVGTDGEFVSWTSQQFGKWKGFLDLTSVNPYQGMTSMLMTINPFVIPGEWVSFLDLSNNIRQFVAYSIYFAEVLGSTFLLGLAIGLSRPLSFSGAIFTVIFLFPPFNYIFGFAGWIATAPIYAHTIFLSNCILSMFFFIGSDRAVGGSFSQALLKNGLLTLGIFSFAMAGFFAAPFYNAGMYCGLAVAGLAMFCTSASPAQYYWRAGAAVSVAVLGYFSGVPEFFLAASEFSTRFSQSSAPTDWFNWSVEFTPELYAASRSILCGQGLACGVEWSYPLQITGGLWVQCVIIAGGVLLGIMNHGRGAAFVSMTGVIWSFILIYYILASIGMVFVPLSSSYFYLLLFPIFGISAAFICRILLLSFLPSIVRNIVVRHAEVLVIVIWCSFPVAVLWWSEATLLSVQQVVLNEQDQRRSSPIVDILKEEASLNPGDTFRGYTATIVGQSGGDMRRELGVSGTEPPTLSQFFAGNAVLRKSGSSHDLNDLWWWNIPTISEYGQAISRPLHHFASRHLGSRSGSLNYLIVGNADPELLAILGTSYIITDRELSAPIARLRQTHNFGENGLLRLYQLDNPNLGNVFVETLLPFDKVGSFGNTVSAAPANLRHQAYVEPRWAGRYSPAIASKFVFKRGGLHVAATSEGRSALLLPVQFSHCYRVDDPSATLIMANEVQSILIFNNKVDANISWDFGFIDSACRGLDLKGVEGVAASTN